ncbi:MAG: hypothetical protein HOJ07_06325 [Rhodospirillaceae bacterium]|nr:hypothetical protein [Rhodospirillaceae bacterium]MBT5675289.1 hypothetical protein [Rhodospirillaceae bacterium]MBT7292079.1 hypothetical protein [Rhodospirillaceae bacterium]
MRRILYNMEFRGRGEPDPEGENISTTKSFAPCVRFTTEINADGVDMQTEKLDGPKAEFVSKVQNLDHSEFSAGKPFREWGTISFGNGNVLNFDTVGAGEFNPVGDDGQMQGGIVWCVEGGTGLFKNATGIITSNFGIDAAGDVIDYHTGVIYLP